MHMKNIQLQRQIKDKDNSLKSVSSNKWNFVIQL